MLRYNLRTLLIVLALGPPVLSYWWWQYAAWEARQERQRAYQPYIDPAWFAEEYMFCAPVAAESDPNAPRE